MPLDTRIALSGQPLQVQFRDLGADYNQLAQMQSAESQNRLAQMQMQENRQMAPLRLQEQQTKAASAKLTYDQAVEARDFIAKTMKAAEENSNGTAPKNPLGVIKALLGHPNKQVQDVGTHMANAYQLIQDFEADQRYATAKGGVAGAPAVAPPVAAAPVAAPFETSATMTAPVQKPLSEMSNTEKILYNEWTGRGRQPQPSTAAYTVNGQQVPFSNYVDANIANSAGAGEQAAMATMPNKLAPIAAPAANVNAMVAPVAKTAADIKAEIDNGDLQFGRSKRWAKERELLVDQYKEALKPGRADSTFAAINPSDYTPESVKAFVVSKNYGDLIPKAGKTDSPISNVNPNDFTPASVQKFALSRNYGDLVLKPVIAAPRPEPAPSITNIVDPTNPNQMIAIDAKRYRGGGVGSPGVIGVGGKEPGAALRVNKVEAGKTQLADDLDNLRSSFRELDRLRAIPSTERNVASNLMSAAQATGVGQALGRAGGTKEQVERDVINSARQRLVASIKNATGMSSKSLDSNMELQTMLRSISDPGQSVEAALRIIQDIEDAYVTGDGTPPKPGVPTPKPAGGGAPPPPPGFKPDN
jgi:hypothetical protein